MAEVQKISAELTGRDIGKTEKVLVEEENTHQKGFVTGRLSNNILVHFEGKKELIGKIVSVKLEEAKGFYYIGTLSSTII